MNKIIPIFICAQFETEALKIVPHSRAGGEISNFLFYKLTSKKLT